MKDPDSLQPPGDGHFPRFLLLFFLLALLVLFGDALFGLKSLVPVGFLHKVQPWRSEFSELARDPQQQYDQLFQFYPWAEFFKHSILDGRLPLWNPYTYLGTPFFANPQTALLFPLTWLHLLFPLYYSFNLVLAAKFLLALAGMAAWLRYLGLSRAAILFGATVYAVSMDTQVSLAFPFSTVTALFPWLLLSAARLLDRPRGSRWLLFSAAVSLAVLAGQPQSALVAFLGLGIFLVFRFFGSRPFPPQLRPYLLVLAAVLLAAGLTAVSWLPAFEYSAESSVAVGPRIAHTGLPYPPGSFLTLVLPDFFGNPYEGNFWGFPGYQHCSFYSSILALLLLPWAFRMRKRGSPFFPLLLGFLGLALMAGLPLFEWLFELPGFDLIKRNKLPFFLIFGLAELAARGLEAAAGFSKLKRHRSTRITVGLTAALLFGSMLGGLFWFGEFLEKLDPQQIAWHGFYRTAIFLAAGTAVLFLAGRLRHAPYLLLILLWTDLGPLTYPLNPRGEYREPIHPGHLPAQQQHALPPAGCKGLRRHDSAAAFPLHAADRFRPGKLLPRGHAPRFRIHSFPDPASPQP